MSLLAQDARLARRVGAIVLAALAAAIAAALLLLDRVELGAPVRIRVAFRHIAGLRDRAPLVAGGRPIGRIEAIVPAPHGADAALDGEVGVVAIVAIERGSAWKVPAASQIFVASRGPLSDRYLEVAPPPGDPGPAVHDGQELRGVDPPSLDSVLQHTWTNMLTYQLFVATIKPELAALRAQLDGLRGELAALDAGGAAAALAREARGLAGAARQTYATALGGDPGLAELRGLVGDARATVQALRAAIDRLAPPTGALAEQLARVRDHVAAAQPVARARQVIADAGAALARLEPLLATLDQLADRLARGEGSIGRLMTDPEFSDDAKDLGKIIKRHPWRVIDRPPS